MSEPKWTAKDWENWRAENLRLTLDGWTIGADYNLDGTVVEWAEKDGVRKDRSAPPSGERT